MSVPVLAETRTIDRVLAFTRDRILPEIFDTVFNNSPALSFMFGKLLNSKFGTVSMNGRGKVTQTGGESVVARHNFGENTTVTELTGPWDTYTPAPSDTLRQSRTNWKHYHGDIVISDYDLLVNTGPEAISNLVRFETENVMRSLANRVASHIYTNGGVSTRISGLDQIISDTTTLQGVVPATYTTFASRGLDGRTVATGTRDFVSGSFTSVGISDMRLLYQNAMEGDVSPQVGLTSHAVFTYYESRLQAQEQFRVGDVANAGFRQLAFKDAFILPDDRATAGTLYFLNFDYYKMHVLAGADFSMGPFIHNTTQESAVASVMLKCNTCCYDRRFLNRMSGITA